MINDKNLKQEGAEGSINHQAQNITINQGLTYKDVKEIVDDLFKKNSIEYSEKAAIISLERALEISEQFLVELNKRNPVALQNMEKPALQYALFTAQKEFVKSGDKDLADMLVDILVDRVGADERTLKQIVLDESLSVVAKLTNNQLDSLTLVFLLKRTMYKELGNIDALDNYLEKFIKPFITDLSQENLLTEHLTYCGCISASTNQILISDIFKKNYRKLFSKGFTVEEYNEKISPDEIYKKYIFPCIQNDEKIQMIFSDIDILTSNLKSDGVSQDMISDFQRLYKRTNMSSHDISKYLMSKYDYMATLFRSWNFILKDFEITSVGIALAHANFRRKTEINVDLDQWI